MGKGNDPTENNKARDTLAEGEGKFRLLMEQSPVDTQVFGMDGTLLEANKAWEEMWETSRKDVVGKYNVLRDPQVQELGILPYFQKAFAGEPQLIPDFEYDPTKIGFPGRIRWIRSRVYPVKDRNGVVRNVILTNEDITEQKKMEEALRRSEHRFREITEAAQDAIFCKDKNRRYTFVNPAVERLFGLPASVLVGKRPEDLYDEEGISIVNEVDDKAFAGKYVNETRSLNIEGETHFFHVIQGPLRVCDGAVVEISGIVRDITVQKRAEREKAVLQSKLEHSRKMEAVGTLAGGIAHEFNNLLVGVVGYAELMLMDLPPDSELRDDLLQILKAARRGKALTKQILTYSRPGKADRQTLDLNDVLESSLKAIRLSLPQNVEIVLNNRVDRPTVLADPTQMHQVLENLLLNAMHAMRETGGKLRIECTEEVVDSQWAALESELKPGKYAKLSVQDTGHGIDKQCMDKIFEPFFSTKKSGEGTGLGLSVVHGIVTNHGGTVKARSTPGLGSVFDVMLPLHGKEQTPSRDESFTVLPRGRGTILVVDDEETILAWSRRALKSMGFETITVQEPMTALRVFRQGADQFDLVIADLTMPGMNGTELIEAMQEIRPDIRALLCTGYGDSMDISTVEALGILEVLSKPVTIADLVSAIRRCIPDNMLS